MKWYLHWFEENEEESKLEREGWATSWEEVMGYFTSWMSKSSDVIKGEVFCYWGENPYGTKPCLSMDIRANDDEE